MENRGHQQNQFLQPIEDSDRQGERNPRVFLKAKCLTELKFLVSLWSPCPKPNFGETNLLEEFRFGAEGNSTSNLNCSENCVGEKAGKFPQPTSISSWVQFGNGKSVDSWARSSQTQTLIIFALHLVREYSGSLWTTTYGLLKTFIYQYISTSSTTQSRKKSDLKWISDGPHPLLRMMIFPPI